MFGAGSVEDDRASQFRETLKAHIAEHYKNMQLATTKQVKNSLNVQNFCPFSGGGDHMLVGFPLHMLVVAEEEEESELYSPIKKGKHRACAEFEYKDLTSQTNDLVQSQLSANMMLISCQILVIRLKNLDSLQKPISSLKSLDTVVSYGISFGSIKPVVIKKLTLDFTNQKVNLQTMYESARDLDKAPRLACATQYVLEQMKRCSLSGEVAN